MKTLKDFILESSKNTVKLTVEELMEVKAGMPVGAVPVEDNDELSLDDLGNVYAGPNRVAMEGKALEHPELYRDSQIDALVEAYAKEGNSIFGNIE